LEGKTSLLVFADSKLPNGFAVRLVILICEANCVYCKAIHTRNEIPIYNLSEVKTSFIVFTDGNKSKGTAVWFVTLICKAGLNGNFISYIL
jgi:hypothetical protein